MAWDTWVEGNSAVVGPRVFRFPAFTPPSFAQAVPFNGILFPFSPFSCLLALQASSSGAVYSLESVALLPLFLPHFECTLLLVPPATVGHCLCVPSGEWPGTKQVL